MCTAHGKTGQFEIEVGLHQGSGLSPFLFTIVLDTISKECRNGLPWELLFADDLAIIVDSEEDLQRRWLKWQIGMESKGLKVNTGKTEQGWEFSAEIDFGVFGFCFRF